MSDLQWMVRDLDPDEEIPEPDQWPEDEFGPVEGEGEFDGGQE